MLSRTSSPLPIATFAELHALEGERVGPTDWLEVGQAEVDAFAAITGDRQWIHVDPTRAAASVFGTTIAHGLYTLGLGPMFVEELLSLETLAHGLNYGYDKVRFTAPLPTGSRIRMHMTITSVVGVDGGTQMTATQTFEREGQDKPVCVAVSVSRFVHD